MLEIICVASITLSPSINNCPQLIDSTPIKTEAVSQVSLANSLSHNIYLAKGRPYKSRYREEADRYQEDYDRNHNEINGAEVRDGRIYRDADNYRRESNEIDRDERNGNSRIYRDTDYHRRESNEIDRDERNRNSRFYQRERYRNNYIRWNSY